MNNNDRVVNTHACELNMKTALGWYPKMKNQFAPLGWKDNLFEFLVMWNGDIVAPTKVPLKKGLESYHHADAQFNFFWKVGDIFECGGDKLHDNAPVWQEYLDGWKPAIITNKFVQGLEITEMAFVHSHKTGEPANGDENMFLWLNFSINKAVRILVPEDELTLYVQIHSHSLRTSMEAGRNSYNIPSAEPYAHQLLLQDYFLMQDDGNARMAVVPDNKLDISYSPVWEKKDWPVTSKNGVLKIKLRLTDGKADFGLIIPMLPLPKDELYSEMQIGCSAALQQSLQFWERAYAEGVSIQTSDKIIENTFRTNPWRMFVTAERNPVFKEYCINNGAFSYDALWPTPGCMSTVWGLDYMGYHKDADKYLEVYRNDQGNTSPPGNFYLPHSGFLSTPGNFEAIRWVNEHGAIIWAVAEHYLLTGDGPFLDKWMPSILKACEWIQVQRNNTAHPGVKGVLPPGTATDDKIHGQFIWNDGWMYKGLTSVVKALAAVNHPETEKWEREAQEYKKAFNAIYMETCKNAPVWIDDSGCPHPFLPTEISGKLWDRNRHAFYLDTGPLFLAFSGLVDIESEIYTAVLKWLREGPHVKYWRFDGCCSQLPVLHHEMSSCEPCYSWNMDINFLRNDRAHFIEGLFAQFAGARNTDLFSDVETRNGMFATNFTTPVTFRHFRNALVFENENVLEFLRMLPAAFVGPGNNLRIKGLPTYFGPMDILIDSDSSGNRTCVNIGMSLRTRPDKIRLYFPPQVLFRKIILNGETYNLNSGYVELEGEYPEKIEMLIL